VFGTARRAWEVSRAAVCAERLALAEQLAALQRGARPPAGPELVPVNSPALVANSRPAQLTLTPRSGRVGQPPPPPPRGKAGATSTNGGAKGGRAAAAAAGVTRQRSVWRKQLMQAAEARLKSLPELTSGSSSPPPPDPGRGGETVGAAAEKTAGSSGTRPPPPQGRRRAVPRQIRRRLLAGWLQAQRAAYRGRLRGYHAELREWERSMVGVHQLVSHVAGR
jgi:hypothetical protein